MAEFKGVDLEDSWILDWRYGADVGGLVFDLEASLWPDHSLYEKPVPDQHTCYKKARLIFQEASVAGELPDPTPTIGTRDPDGSIDYGSVNVLELEDGLYHLVTDFADLHIHCVGLELNVTGGTV